MTVEVNTRDLSEVQKEVQALYRGVFPDGDPDFVQKVFGWTEAAFSGRYKNYLPIDARYHDLEHTLQVTLCMMRLLRGRYLARAIPPLPQRMVELGIAAILFHDTGYLKNGDDAAGTGAKYTLIHVVRSIDFAGTLLAEKGFPPDEIQTVQNMIRCTGVDAKLRSIPFQSEEEKIAGFALGTADLLGQMAAPDYIEKLPVLYSEFREAFEYTANAELEEPFSSAQDLLSKTPYFWDKIVKPKIEVDFLGLYRFLNDPFPTGPNLYVEAIEANIRRLKSQLKQAA